MFNRKYKQRITELELENKQLQQQYQTIHSLLLKRQDEVISLQAQVQVLIANQQDNNGNSFSESVKDLQERLSTNVNNLQELVEELKDLYSDSDEDEDEDEDDSWDE